MFFGELKGNKQTIEIKGNVSTALQISSSWYKKNTFEGNVSFIPENIVDYDLPDWQSS